MSVLAAGTAPIAAPPAVSGADTAAGLARRRRARRRAKLARFGVGALGLAGVLAAWQLVAVLKHDPALVPTVPQTLRALITYSTEPYPAEGLTLPGHALSSLRRVLTGFAAGSALGILLGSAMASTRAVRYLVDPLLEILRPLPPLAFIPLFIVWFGIENPSKIGLIVLGATPIVTIATLGALDAVPPDLARAGQSLGAGRWRVLFTVRLRAALPGVVTGMRLAMGGAWASLVAAELVGADTGVGFLTLQAGNYLQMDVVFAGIGIIALLGFLTDAALRLLLRFADPSTR